MATEISQELNLKKSQKSKIIMPLVQISKPTPLEIFLGQYFEKRKNLNEQLSSAEKMLEKFNEKSTYMEIADIIEYKNTLQEALDAYELSPKLLWLYQQSLLIFILLISVTEILFIQLYTLWHGADFLSLNLYSQSNIDILAKIGFVNGATTMSIAAEVLMWSSLGCWAQQSYEQTSRMRKRLFKFVDDGLGYIGNIMRTTSIAAIIVIILRLAKFSIFGVSLDETSSLAFDATIGISFLLGFFGNDSYKLLTKARQTLLGNAFDKENNDKTENI